MRAIMATALLSAGLLAGACGTHHTGDGNGDDAGGSNTGPDACVGLQCAIVDCSAQPQPTTLSGKVFAPNGTLPLYNVNVYVPNSDPGAITPGLDGTCDVCSAALPGDPIVMTTTDEHGNFSLTNVPVADNLPVIIQVGKWRKILKLQTRPPACAVTTLPLVDTTLPATMTESGGDIASVDMPQIAISTGGADALECLVRKLGIADKEITTAGGTGRVHLYSDNNSGTNKFKTGFAGGSGAFADSSKLWGTATPGTDAMSKYDIALFSCEGAQNPGTKPQAAMDAVKKYADGGGRLFLSHWHNIWVEGSTTGGGNQAPAVWPAIGTFSDSNNTLGNNTVDNIDQDPTDNPKGVSFAQWMIDPTVAGTPATETVAGEIPLEDNTGKLTCSSIDKTKAEQWVTHTKNAAIDGVQNFQFTTPNEDPISARCGKVVFSDMHVSGDSSSSSGGTGYPSLCSSDPLTAQEKALAFMFFDIESCVGPIIP